MSREYFATKFVSGKAEGSQKMRWWLRHSCSVGSYLRNWDSKRLLGGESERKSIAKLLQKSCVDWNGMVYRSQKVHLMTEHVGLEMLMVDKVMSVVQEKSHSKCVLPVADLLIENVAKQAEHHKFQTQDFPVNQWRELMLNHVRLFTESVRWFVTPDDQRYASCEERRMENTVALAAFSTEWL
jgi:hypothetical protein